MRLEEDDARRLWNIMVNTEELGPVFKIAGLWEVKLRDSVDLSSQTDLADAASFLRQWADALVQRRDAMPPKVTIVPLTAEGK